MIVEGVCMLDHQERPHLRIIKRVSKNIALYFSLLMFLTTLICKSTWHVHKASVSYVVLRK